MTLTTLTGSDGNDTLVGNAGHNTLIGGEGSDRLTGGSGSDVFLYNTLAEGGDTITDWTVDDVIQVSVSGFGGGLVAGTPLQLGESAATGVLVMGADPIGASANFLYDNGILNFDPDGIGPQAAISIVTLDGAPPLTVLQIQVI